MKWLISTLLFVSLGLHNKSALAVPGPTSLEQLVRKAEWIVIGKLGPLRPAYANAPTARHGDIAVEEVLKGPRNQPRPKQLTLFTIDPEILKTPDAPAGAMMYSAGQRGIWLLEPSGKNVYKASHGNSLLPMNRRQQVAQLLPIGGEKANGDPESLQDQVVVSKDGSGDCRTITEAVARVKTGGTIRVRPGVYPETIYVGKSLTIVGDGTSEKVVVRSQQSDGFYLEADKVSLINLTIECQASPKQKVYAVDAATGEITIEKCDLSSTSLACLGVHGKQTRATIRECAIHDGQDAGVFVYDGGTADLKNCQISNNKEGNVVVWAKSHAILQGCRLHGSADVGLDVREQGRATLIDCQIYGNRGGQLSIEKNSQITFQGNTIKDRLTEPSDGSSDPPRNPTEIFRVLKDARSTSEQLEAVVSQLQFGDEFAVQPVETLLRSQDPARRAKGIHAVQRLGRIAESTVPALIEILQTDGNFLRQTGAAAAIGYTGTQDPRAVKALRMALSSSNDFLREAAASELLKIGPPAADAAVDDLQRLREDPARRVRAAAAATEVALTGNSEAVKTALTLYTTHYSGSLLGQDIVLGMGLAGLTGADASLAIISLDAHLGQKETQSREDVAFALAAIGPDVSVELKGLLKALDDEEPLTAWYAAAAVLTYDPQNEQAKTVLAKTLPSMITEQEQHLGEMTFPDRGKRITFCKVCGLQPALCRPAEKLLRRIAAEAPDEPSQQAAKRALIRFQKKAR